MMGQIDEFNRIRARVKQAAISEKLKPADVDKFDQDVKKCLDDADAKTPSTPWRKRTKNWTIVWFRWLN
jgi:hypothetical protein